MSMQNASRTQKDSIRRQSAFLERNDGSVTPMKTQGQNCTSWQTHKSRIIHRKILKRYWDVGQKVQTREWTKGKKSEGCRKKAGEVLVDDVQVKTGRRISYEASDNTQYIQSEPVA